MSQADLKIEGRPKSGIALLVILTACYLAGFIGSFATNAGLAFWYQIQAKPSWNPPVWVFAPVWTVLYGLMGLAAWIIWQCEDSRRRTFSLSLFGGQLVLNAIWPYLFFGFHKTGVALTELAILWIAVLATAIGFARIRGAAAAMILVYLAWLSFAFALNFEIFRMNP